MDFERVFNLARSVNAGDAAIALALREGLSEIAGALQVSHLSDGTLVPVRHEDSPGDSLRVGQVRRNGKTFYIEITDQPWDD